MEIKPNEAPSFFLSIPIWIRGIYSFSFKNFANFFQVIVLFIFPVSIALGFSIWFAFEDVIVNWNPDLFKISFSEYNYSIFVFLVAASALLGIVSLLILSGTVIRTYNRLQQTDDDPKEYQSDFKEYFSGLPSLFLGSVINFGLFYLIFFAPGQLLNLNLNESVIIFIGLAQIVLFFAGSWLLISLVFWPVKVLESKSFGLKQFSDSIRLVNSYFFKVLGRLIILVILCYFTFGAASSIGEIIISILDLDKNSIELGSFSEKWSAPIQYWIGDTPAVSSLRMFFTFFGFSIATIFWTTGIMLLYKALSENNEIKYQDGLDLSKLS